MDVIKIDGWNTETGYFSIPPSPNIPNYVTSLIYNGMCLLEGTNLSEGRGTDTPFLLFGAPWLKGYKLTSILKANRVRVAKNSNGPIPPWEVGNAVAKLEIAVTAKHANSIMTRLSKLSSN